MSIHIGSVPLSQNSTDVFTIYSTKSNVVKLTSPSNNVFMDIGDYNFGQRSLNDPFVFSYKNSNIITYNSNNVSFNRDIVATCNLNILGSLKTSTDILCGNLITSNIVIKIPILNGSKFIDCTSNNIDTFYLTNNDKGVGYIGGRFGIGVIPNDKKYSLMTSSNIYVDGDISGKRVVVDTIFSTNTITIDSPRVIVNNLQLGGQNAFTNLQCAEIADMKGLFLASNVNIYNNITTRNPFKINQRLINGDYGNPVTGNPISIRSQHVGISTEHPTILELSSCGNLVLGSHPSTQNVGGLNIISDYVIRGNIPTNREQHFKGYLSFASNGVEKTSFNVNKTGQLSIGSLRPSAILDIVNDFTGSEANYVKPSSIIYLRNKNTSNVLPFLKCENSNLTNLLQITSNATICFKETPVNIELYNIESDNNFLSNIDTCKISSYYSDGIINMSYSTLSNLNNVVSCNIDVYNLITSNMSVQNINANDCYIQHLEVGSFSTVGLDVSPALFEIQSDSLSVTGKKMILKEGTDTLPNYITNDKLIIKTEATTGNANGYTIYGNNQSIKLLCINESAAPNAYVAKELRNSTGGFAFVSKLTSTPFTLPELYITPIKGIEDPYSDPALTLYYDNSILLKGDLFVQITNSSILQNNLQKKSVNIGNGMMVFSSSESDTGFTKYQCLSTNKYGSLDIGRGISDGKGPFNKQGGWQTVHPSTGIYIIPNDDYGETTNTAGTIFIQVQQEGIKIGNASLSFLRLGSTSTADLFTISTHKSSSLNVFQITAIPTGIQVKTDTGCKVCWTSIGSC